MSRIFSVNRRRPGLVDLVIPQESGIGSYVFGYSTNFDLAFTDFQTVPVYGYRSKTVVDNSTSGSSFRGLTRFIFNPADYSIDDSKFFWLHVKKVPFGGVPGTASAPHLVLPYSSVPSRALNIHGTVSGTTTEITLPFDVSNGSFRVEGSDDLIVSFEPKGEVFSIPPLSTDKIIYSSAFPTYNQLFLASAGVSTEFYASFRMLNSLAL
jgi:hypothetical protein